MRNRRFKTLTGLTVSRIGAKSIQVVVDCKVRHPRYGKYVKRRTKLGVHDEHNQAEPGDIVEVTECRPYSKHKSWRLVRIVDKAVEVGSRK